MLLAQALAQPASSPGRAWSRRSATPPPAHGACRRPHHHHQRRRVASDHAPIASGGNWSQASITTSTGCGSSAGQFSGSRTPRPRARAARVDVGEAPARARTHHAPASRRAPAWRLMLDSATWSRSTSVPATPLPTASAAHEPTPPTPITATRAARMRAREPVAVEPRRPPEAALEVGLVDVQAARSHHRAHAERSTSQNWYCPATARRR